MPRTRRRASGRTSRVRRKPQRPNESFVGDQASGLQQRHRRGLDRVDNQPVAGEQALLGDGQGAGVDPDRAGQRLADGGLGGVGHSVGDQREFVDGVPPARAQQPRRLGDDRCLGGVVLPAQHRLADHHIGASARQARPSRVGDLDGSVGADNAPHRPSGVGVLLDAHVGTGPVRDDLGGRAAQPRRQLDHVSIGHLGAAQQCGGQRGTAGPQHAFTQPRQQPMAPNRVIPAAGQRQHQAPWLVTGGSPLCP